MASTHAQRSKRPLPFFEGILPIDASRISTDVVAGATLAALAIPEVMGYTTIAGMPVITGLYTIILPIIAFAILGSSRHLVVGADFSHGRDPGDRPAGHGTDRRVRPSTSRPHPSRP